MYKIAVFYELSVGGAKRAANELAKRFRVMHNMVDLYYVDFSEDPTVAHLFNNTFFYRFVPKVWKGKDWKVRLYKDTVELLKLYVLHKIIAKNIDQRKYDFVFVHPSKYTQAPFLLPLLKTKSIYYCQEPLRIVYDPYVSDISNIKFPKNIYELINRGIRKWIDLQNFKKASLILANSKFSKEFIRKSYGLLSKVCYLGVDINLFKPVSINKSIDILYMGNNDKSYDLLIDSLKLFKNKPSVDAIFRNDKEPEISDKELAQIYNKSKILVALNQNEPFGLIPLEAMASGIPVIAVNEGGYKETVIDGETGFLIPRDAEELYHKLKKLLEDNKLRTQIGKNARQNVLSSWTWKKSAKRFLNIIKNE